MAAAQILQERSTGDGRTCDEKCDGKNESGSGIGDRGVWLVLRVLCLPRLPCVS